MLRRLFRLGALLERLLDGVRPDRRDADVRQPDPPAAVHLLRRHADDGPVEQPAPELDVLVRSVGDRKHDLGHDLVRSQRRGEQVLEEIVRWNRPLVGDDVRVEHQRKGWVVAGRVRVRNDPAHGAHVADLVVPHLTRHLGEQWQLVLHHFRVLDGHVPRQRADAELLPVLFDVVQVLDAVDVDQRAWLREAQPHQRDEAVPTRQHLRILPVFAEQLGCLLD